MSLRYAMVLLNAGTIVGAYRVVNVIGYGGFGAVYEAEDTRTGRAVALKETFDPSSTRSFQSEFAVLHQLNHDHLPHYYEMFEHQGNGYLVMELIPGQSLLDVLLRRQGQPLAEAQVMGYAIQICDALIYLHKQNPVLIHRDIKPANVRLTPEGLIKLVDFGLLKQGTDKTGRSRMGLTPAYAPLEQWGDTGLHTTPQSDIYSLGATLYHLLTGQSPHTVADRIAMDDPLLTPCEINPRVSPHVSDAIMKALAVQPKNRFPDAVTFKQALVYANSPTLHTTIPGRHEKPVSEYLPPISEPQQYLSEPTHVYSEPQQPQQQYVSEPTQIMSEPQQQRYMSEPTQVLSEPQQPQPAKKNNMWLIGVAVVLLIFVGVGAWWATTTGDNPPTPVANGEKTVPPSPSSESTKTNTPGETSDDHYDKGEALLEDGEYDEAIEQFTSAITLDPDHADAYNKRGYAYYSKKTYNRAIQDYDKAIALDDEYTEAYRNRGLAYYANGEYDAAIADYTEAIALDDEHARTYYYRGLVYSANGEYDAAIADYDEAIALDDTYADAYTARASSYKALDNYDAAIQNYNEAITLNPESVVAYNNRARAYQDKGELDLAIQDYNTAIELDSEYAVAYYNRGRVYKDKGDNTQAIADFQDCRELALSSNDASLQELAEQQLDALDAEY
jgi:serine/threonine protein kinase